MKFGWSSNKEQKQIKREEVLSSFEAEIQNQEKILFGTALFFEGLSIILADDEAVLETHRKEFRNYIQSSRDSISKAAELLKTARQDPRKIHLLEQVKFSPFPGHPNPEEMAGRSLAMYQVYQELFPGRPETDPLGEKEIIMMMRRASDRINLPE